MASPIPISPLSASQTLVSWITEHGREPLARECCAANGLLFWRTFMRKIPGETFSATISSARLLVEHMPKPRRQMCLGPKCDASFPYVGYHFCDPCRMKLGYASEDSQRNGRYQLAHNMDAAARESENPPLSTQKLRAYGLDTDMDDIDTSYDDHAYGFDTLISAQLNSWRQIPRKNRFFN